MKQCCRCILAVSLLTMSGLTVGQERIESSTSVGTLPSTSGLNMNRTNELDISYMSSEFAEDDDNDSMPGMRLGYGKKVWLQTLGPIGVSTTFNPEFIYLSDSEEEDFVKTKIRMAGIGYTQKMTMHFLNLGNVIELSALGGIGYADADITVSEFSDKFKLTGSDFYQRLGLELGLNIADRLALTLGYQRMYFEPSFDVNGQAYVSDLLDNGPSEQVQISGKTEEQDLDMEVINIGCSVRF